MFYEFKHPIDADYFTVSEGENLTFPAHLHRCFEFISVTEGEMLSTVGRREYSLSVGDALMIFPNQIHSIKTESHSKHIIAIFSPELVSAYFSRVSGTLPESALFRPEDFCVKKLTSLIGGAQTLEMKGILYLLCAGFDKNAVYRKASDEPLSLLREIFAFIDKNYDSDCSLEKLARSVGYGYNYLSSFFRKAVGMSYHDYVTSFRLGKVCHLLESTDDGILSIANECGFGSLRSLNRNFREKLGMTPGDYRSGTMQKNAPNV